MNLSKKYLQFNDLVIDNHEMLSDADLSGGTKTQTQEYGYGHGSYAPFKSKQQFQREQEVSMTLKLGTKKLSCDQKEHYKKLAILNFLSPGKLWAIEGKQLIWAWAFVSEYGEPYEFERDTMSIDLDFVLPEGVWHIADTRKVFLQPYNPCDVLDCVEFKTVDDCGCCICTPKPKAVCQSCLCECEHLNAEYSLCEMKDDALKVLGSRCGDTYKIIYNCEAGARIWSEEAMLGTKICKEDVCKGMVAGNFYSDTLVDSRNVTITIDGVVKNPLLTINDNTMRIMGEYDGKLTITPTGDIFYQKGCCQPVNVDINNMIIPDGSTFGFLIHHGNNSLILETNNCCDMTCVYVKVDSLTI